MQSKEHWEHAYSSKATDSVSWFQKHADLSLHLIEETGVSAAAAIIDVGGGASTLVDDLLAKGYTNLTVLDLSRAALLAAEKRLGPGARLVTWLEADITRVDLPAHSFDVWHDRAVFHFLVSPGTRRAYVENVVRSIKPGAHVIIATFAEDGPTQCSGLPVARYGPSELHAALGARFTLVQHKREMHHTPSGTVQPFTYCHFRRLDSAPQA